MHNEENWKHFKTSPPPKRKKVNKDKRRKKYKWLSKKKARMAEENLRRKEEREEEEEREDADSLYTPSRFPEKDFRCGTSLIFSGNVLMKILNKKK